VRVQAHWVCRTLKCRAGPQVFCAERFLHKDAARGNIAGGAHWKVAARDHTRAVVYTLASTVATVPFTAVYVSAATHIARFPAVRHHRSDGQPAA
jgi:hypothetical protein